MKYYEPEEKAYIEIDDENLTGVYPRRSILEGNYEVWQHTYVNNDIVEEDFDNIGIIFGETIQIFVFTKFKKRFKSPNYINRILLLVGDLNDDVEIVEIHRFKYASDVLKYMKKYHKKRFKWFSKEMRINDRGNNDENL